MIALLLLASQAPDLILARGISLQGPYKGLGERYWDVTEAEVDAAGAELPIPTTFALTGNAQRKILIKFGSIDLATLRNSKIVDGTLVFTLVEESISNLKAVKIIRKPWLSPGINAIARKVQGIPPSEQKSKDGKPVIPFAPGVSWNRAGGDIGNWTAPGLNAASDAEPINATFQVEGSTVRIKNLGPTLQYWKTHEGENFGFLLEFSGETGFWGSTSPEARPRLEMKLEPATIKEPQVTVVREGSSVNVQAAEPINSIEVYKGVRKVSSEKTTKIPLSEESGSKDDRGALTRLVVNFEDPNIPQEVINIDPSAPWVKLTSRGARLWNQLVDQSFYSFSRFGGKKHVNGEGDKDIDVNPVPGLAAFASGSHMMETMMLPGLVVPPRSTRSLLFRQMVSVEAGPLSLAQMDFLVNGKISFPQVILAKVVNYENRVIEGAKMTMTNPAGETVDIAVDQSGVATLPKFKEDLVGDYTFTVTANGRKGVLKTPMTTFSDLYARGNRLAISIELPFNLPIYAISDDTNLAAGKPVKDKTNSFPAQLVGLVDDNVNTTYTLAGNSWVEIDLGRDRLLGEIIFQGSMPAKFQVLTYGTTDKVEQAAWWIDEIDTEKFRREYGEVGDLTYRPTPNSSRYVRIQNMTETPVTLQGVKIFAARKS